ncbi:MAG: cytochrome P450 [Propionibacteriaceae bacterium]|nr:cytochrome P450 [Propionibacteriaceae bacterium]
MTGRRRAWRPEESPGPRLEREGRVVRIRCLAAARQALRERRRTTQAGFTAEFIPKGVFRHHPILISDGPLHDEQRRKVGRFLAPKVVASHYGALMAEVAERLLTDAQEAGEFDLSDLALLYTVEVTAEVVGLTESSIPDMARRLVSFFNQPPLDITRPDLGRTRRDWMRAAVNGIVPVLRFYWADVRRAIKVRRREPREDIISHLIAEGYSDTDILVECVTYGTAGMVTTREFICMAAWHLLDDAELRGRYLAGDQQERVAVLAEILRLEPVVGHLYRRVVEAFDLHDGDATVTAEVGDLIDVATRETNTDVEAVGGCPLELRPGRGMPRGVDATGLTFGDGAHKCPGQPLAIAEADALLIRLLPTATLRAEPTIGWDDLIEGYALTGLRVVMGPKS